MTDRAIAGTGPGRVRHDPRPARRRVRIASASVGAMVAAIAGVLYLASRPGFEDGRRGWMVGLAIAGLFAAALVAGTWVFTASRVAARFERLARGDVLGRWLVDPPTWARMILLRRELDQRPDTLKTELDLPLEAPPGGMEIVVCEDAVYVGERIWKPLFIAHGIPALLRDGWLDFIQHGDEMPTHVVRVPVGDAPDAQAAAAAIVRRFDKSMEPYRTAGS